MSHEEAKEKHSKRILKKINHIKRQLRIRKSHSVDAKYEEPHRFHKISGMSCGDSNYVTYGNPRKFFKEPTIQEKRFIQTQKWFTE